MSRTITVEDYSVLCDAVERAWHGWPVEREPDEAPVFHTSSYAREAANRIIRDLNLELEVPDFTADDLQRIADYYPFSPTL